MGDHTKMISTIAPMEHPKNMSVFQLREELKNRSLSPTGLKAALVQRLLDALTYENGGLTPKFDGEYSLNGIVCGKVSYMGKWRKIDTNWEDVVCYRRPLCCVADEVLLLAHSDTNDNAADFVLNYFEEPFTLSMLESDDNNARPPDSLVNYSTTAIGNKVFIYGGSDGINGDTMDDGYLYNRKTDMWVSFRMKGDILPPMESHSATAVGDKYIYIFGGRSKLEEIDDYIYSNDLYIVNIKNGLCTKEECDGNILPMAGHTTVYSNWNNNNQLYIFGGIIEEKNNLITLSDLYSFDIEKKIWKKVSANGRSVPSRAFHTANIVNNNMFVVGGYSLSMNMKKSPSEVFYLELETLSWKQLDIYGKQPCGRANHSSFTIGTEIVIVGGGSDSTHFNSVYTLETQYKNIVPIGYPSLSIDIQEMLENNIFWDIRFLVGKKQIRAHKVIISSRSEMLKKLCIASGNDIVIIENVKLKAFLKFLELLYSGKQSYPKQLALTILDLCVTYEIPFKFKKDYKLEVYNIELEELNVLNSSDEFSDIVINDKNFHNVILEARCAYGIQKDIFTRIGNIPDKYFDIFYECVYGGFIISDKIEEIVKNEDIDSLFELVDIANDFFLIDLKMLCESSIAKLIQKSNVKEVYSKACSGKATQIKAYCMSIINSNPTIESKLLEHPIVEHEIEDYIRYKNRLLNIPKLLPINEETEEDERTSDIYLEDHVVVSNPMTF
eukprot:TRINITY_DN12324_c0_g1_i1.p1 TRINITY_DN12324_c0_g1~~TRINITY_DN12324_c0_g1_i1.p1  ORF type:complete len:724 (-),score=162.75 TRINITY_DN12324_c0_g1_i1:29-2200(-)